ncbi:DUF2059 domain-containing protein [Novosphingobium sp.]|uniref:DUF2059 domain-containing protein n=1 Tax=Novosphingobium sp. TaxID=1874826 RepID=UPI0025D80246|nr:DUF2059 domain-containing protein [Novosphingobium sp.]
MTRWMFGAALAASLCTASPALAEAPATAPAAAPAPVDPARLAIARTTVNSIFPVGTYARIMDGTLTTMIPQIMGGVGKIPLRDLAGIAGLSQEKVAEMGPGTIKQIMEILDPAYERRTQAMMTGMFREMGGMMASFEPTMRDGLANAYARRFTAQQLADMNAFFATPSGKAYAADAMTIFMDPEVMSAMQAFMPKMMKQMPDLIKKVSDSTADLPKRKHMNDLTPSERKRLAELLGVKESELEASEAAKPGASS